MGKIQKQDIKTAAELVSAGATAADLPQDTQVYVSALGLNKTLSQAITDGDFAAGNPVKVEYYTATAQSIASSSTTQVVVFNTMVVDSHSAFNSSTGVFTAPYTKTYLITSTISFSANASGRRGIFLGKNGSYVQNGSIVPNAGGGAGTNINSSFLVSLTSGDTIDIRAYQESGSTLTLQASSVDNWISIVSIG